MAFTYFFRDMNVLNLIEQYVIPQLKGRMFLNIWDAGCATGEEPYSLAIIFRENMGQFLFRNVRIHASDINEQFGKQIRNGVYHFEQIRRIPAPIQKRYFVPAAEAGEFFLDQSLRKVVSFYQHDLTSLEPIRGEFGLILCKNVLMHVRAEQRVGIVRMFHKALCPGGFFATEQTQKLPEEADGWFRQLTPNAQVFERV